MHYSNNQSSEIRTNTKDSYFGPLELEVLLLPLDDCQVDCDGMTYLVSEVLTQAGIQHQCQQGYVKDNDSGNIVTPHCWVTLPDDHIIDFRLRKWLGDYDHVPHGIFKPEGYPNYSYTGSAFTPENIDTELLKMISDEKLSHV